MGNDYNPNTYKFDKAMESLPPSDIIPGETISETDARYLMEKIGHGNLGLRILITKSLEDILSELENNPDIMSPEYPDSHITLSKEQLQGIVYNVGTRCFFLAAHQIGTWLHQGQKLAGIQTED